MYALLTRKAVPAVTEKLANWKLIEFKEHPTTRTKQLTVLLNPNGEYAYRLTMQQDGTLTRDENSPNAADHILLSQGQYAHTLPEHVSALLYAEVQKTASHKGWAAMANYPWDRHHQVNEAVNTILESAIVPSTLPRTRGSKAGAQPHLSNLTQRVNQIIRNRFLDQKSKATALKIFEPAGSQAPLTIRAYNEAHLNGDLLLKMNENTPTALLTIYKRKVILQQEKPARAGHPGQIIRRIKDFLDFSPAQWKQLCRLANAYPKSIHIPDPDDLRVMTQTMVDVNRPQAPPDKFVHLLSSVNAQHFFANADWSHGDPWKAWTNLANQYLGHPDSAEDHIRPIIDALRAHITQDEPWGRGDWETLQERSERWHRQHRQAPRWSMPDHALRLSWDSLVKTTTIGQITYRPVLNARELDNLGNIMGNCLSTFWDRCNSGTCRIFSAHDNDSGQLLAAIEISQHSGRWNTGQIEGPSRNPYPPEIKNHAQQLADSYHHAENAGPQPAPTP